MLVGLSLSIGAAAKVCIVGRTGSGKSTLVSCLSRLVELDSWSGPVAGGRDASAIPSVWFYVCPVVGRLFRTKCLTCLRGASGGRLLAYGLQLVWSEQVGAVVQVQTLEGRCHTPRK